MTIIDSQFNIIDSCSLDVSLEQNANLVVAWLYLLHCRAVAGVTAQLFTCWIMLSSADFFPKIFFLKKETKHTTKCI